MHSYALYSYCICTIGNNYSPPMVIFKLKQCQKSCWDKKTKVLTRLQSSFFFLFKYCSGLSTVLATWPKSLVIWLRGLYKGGSASQNCDQVAESQGFNIVNRKWGSTVPKKGLKFQPPVPKRL